MTMTLSGPAPRGEANTPYEEQPFTASEERLFRAALEALNREGFRGARPFSAANKALADAGRPLIDWDPRG